MGDPHHEQQRDSPPLKNAPLIHSTDDEPFLCTGLILCLILICMVVLGSLVQHSPTTTPKDAKAKPATHKTLMA